MHRDGVRRYIHLTLSWCCGRLRAPWSRRPPSRSASASNPSIEDSASLSQAKNLSRDRSKLWREFIAECSSFPRLMMLGGRGRKKADRWTSTATTWLLPNTDDIADARPSDVTRNQKLTRSDDVDFATFDSITFYQTLQLIRSITHSIRGLYLTDLVFKLLYRWLIVSVIFFTRVVSSCWYTAINFWVSWLKSSIWCLYWCNSAWKDWNEGQRRRREEGGRRINEQRRLVVWLARLALVFYEKGGNFFHLIPPAEISS